MAKTAVIYDSKGSNTRRMAEILKEEFERLNAAYELFHVDQFPMDRMTEFDGFFVGTPNYFGGMTARLKRFFDESVKHFNKLDGKVGAAFCSTGVIGGGAETALMAVIRAMLIHGMIVQGNPGGGHYGVVSISKPDQRVEKELCDSAQRFISLLHRVVRG
jgi:NAD(P)H dehydrogenase (quinone)